MSTTAAALDIARSLAVAARAGHDDDEAIHLLASLHPGALADALCDPSDRLAFWINVYNGAVRARLLRDPEAYTRRWRFFASHAIVVAGQRLSPNAIEHGILRRSALLLGLGFLRNPIPSRFERMHRVERVDPRIHFALNCGARSCPPLSVYDPATLDAQLDAATRSYLASEAVVVDAGRSIRVPRLLRWYLGDFGGRAGILALLARYDVIPRDATPRVTYGEYDWTLAVGPAPGARTGVQWSSPSSGTRVPRPAKGDGSDA